MSEVLRRRLRVLEDSGLLACVVWYQAAVYKESRHITGSNGLTTFIVWLRGIRAISSHVNSLKYDLCFAVIRVDKFHVCVHE